VCVSYAGNLEDVRIMPAYRGLREACRAAKIELVLSTMSMTGGLNVGADAFSIAFACDKLDLS
jgi:fatty acid-binding protein DegV